ncbi:MAG: insulinase family protein [Rhizobacter sp.]|nr:insulinase family protein [Chlorobiales bacterium]
MYRKTSVPSSKKNIAAKSSTAPVKSISRIVSNLQQSTLPNGMKVITEPVPNVHSVSVGLWTETGSRDETLQTNGISHFIEHLVFKGTKKRNYIAISRSMEEVGGYLNAFTSKDQTCFYARCLDEHTGVAVDVLSDLVFNPIFPESELEKEKQVVIEEMKSSEDTPDDIIFDDFEKSIYGAHPMAMPIIGTEETVRSFSRAGMQKYMQQRYTTDKMLLVAAGNVRHEEMVRLAEKFIPKRKSPSQLPRVKFDPKAYQPVHLEVPKPINQAHVVMGFPFERDDKTYYAAMLLNTVLGGGMSSRLNLRVREKFGLVYTIYSFINASDESNEFGVYLGTDGGKVEKALKLVREELEKLAEKAVPDKELELSKAQLKGSIIMGQESMSSRMMRIARNEYYFGGDVPGDLVIEDINRVTAADVRKVAETLFKPSLYSTVIFKPKKK